MEQKKAIRKSGEGSITYLKYGKVRLRVTHGTKIIKDKKTGLPKKIKNTKDFYGNSEEEVREKFREWKNNYNPLQESANSYENRLLMECVYEWIKNVKYMTLKSSSYSRLVQVADDYVNPRLCIYKISEITSDIIQFNLINDLRQKGYSYSTIKKAVNILTGFYRWAVGTQKVSFNPCTALVMPSEKLIKEEKGQTDEIKYYTRDEIQKMKECADSTSKYCKEVANYRFPRAYAYLFIIYTGLRMGELLALKWSDYNPENHTISINKDVSEYKDAATGKIVTKIQLTPKTSSSQRVLTLNDSAIEILNTIKERTFNPDNEYIVANKNIKGEKEYVAPSNFRNAFRRFCEYAEINYKGVHALRHTFASLMFAQGIDIKYISLWLGHSSVQITYDTYVHIMEEVGYKDKTVIPAIQL